MTTARAKRYFHIHRKRARKVEEEPAFITIDMPEVKDIPGQENIRPPRMREMMDTTASSAGEEGEGILDDLNKDMDDESLIDDDANVSSLERNLLKQAERPVNSETKDRRSIKLDQTDGETALNESANPDDMGEDLDVPGAELDDDDEAIGEEDEENNAYSRPD